MKKTGQLLKDKREAAKLSLSEVALATKINPKILTAIEEGDETRLPAKTFLKGFLKAYAAFLKIDADEVLRSYQDEMGGPAPVREHEINKPQPVAAPASPSAGPAASPAPKRRMGDENSSGLRTAAVVVIVMLIGVIIGVRELIEKYQREKQVESAAIKVSPLAQPPLVPETKPAESAPVVPTTPAPDMAATPAPPVPAAGTADVPAPAKPVQNDMIITPPIAATPAPTTPPPPPPPAPKEAVKPPEPKAPPPEKKAADEVPPASDTVNADPAPTKKSRNEIILEALDKVDVKFQIKGETKRLSLGPTQVHTIYSDQPITLDLSDGGAVNIILNGRERGVPGDLGKPKTVKIP